MATSINSATNVVPWMGLRQFVQRYDDIFLPRTKTVIAMDVVNESNPDPDPQRVKVTVAHPKDSEEVRIYGLTKSYLGIVSEFKIDLENNRARISLPQFGSGLDLSPKGCIVSLPRNLHPDVITFTEDAVRFFSVVLNSLINKDEKVVQETLAKLLLEMYPHRYN